MPVGTLDTYSTKDSSFDRHDAIEIILVKLKYIDQYQLVEVLLSTIR